MKLNLLANFTGKGWTALMTFALVPLYIGLLGVEAYGLIGFYVTLQVAFSLLDLGLSTTINRELSRLSVLTGKEHDALDMVRSFEFLYWAMALFIAFLIIAISPLLAGYWIMPVNISPATVQQVIILMGISIAAQFPYALYMGGLMGTQRQVLCNGIDISLVTVRAVGTVLVLLLISPTVQAFFVWQAIVNVIQTVVYAYFLYKSMPRAGYRPRFRLELLKKVWRFTAGVSGINLLAVALTQIDKVVLSKLLTLETYGIYMIASTLSSAVGMAVGPLFAAVFPRLSQMVAQEDTAGIRELYHQCCQLMSVIILPLAILVAIFSYPLLVAWTGDPDAAAAAAPIAALLVIGTALNALMNIPYALQLANGWTRLTLVMNTVATIIIVPLVVAGALSFGAVGAAAMWVLLNVGYVTCGMYLMHRRLLKGELARWYATDLGVPLAGAILVPLVALLFYPGDMSRLSTFAFLAILLAVSLLFTVLVTPYTRRWASTAIRALREGGVAGLIGTFTL
ncbi:MAG TPA: oligosaccharide flippase family protein [Methanocella sp.]|jgi:O-antigen/teichoic acid export membrane protein